MKELMATLVQIQERQFIMGKDPEKDVKLSSLRAQALPQILTHMDRMFARGKKAVAAAVNGACTACHLRLPSGTVASLRRGVDVQLCDCGRYLYQVESPEASPLPPAMLARQPGRRTKAKR
jgi:predicted  nucleic acid-binding Zn-ribbon protein